MIVERHEYDQKDKLIRKVQLSGPGHFLKTLAQQHGGDVEPSRETFTIFRNGLRTQYVKIK